MEELQNVFGVKKQEYKFHNVKWQPVENSENIITVSESEIQFHANKDNEESLKDNIAIEEKISRIVQTSYIEFREKKLEEMMNGVLEVK